MELRTEPRFETRSSAVVEVIRDKVYTYNITITEVSAFGLKIEMAEELRVGETSRLLVNNYHLFAQVRSCTPSKSGFVIGLERIDAWNGPADVVLVGSPVQALGRPKLKNPLGNLHSAALGDLFANPRFRPTQMKYEAVFIAVGCIALAGFGGFGIGATLHGKSHVAKPAKTEAAEQLPVVPKVAAPNLIASQADNKAVVVPPMPQARVEETPVQKASVVAPSKVAVRPTIVSASRISIKATDVSWLTACVDGAKVLDTLLVKGYVGEIPFSRQATLRFGNAGAIELAVGNQPATKLGQPGEVRTVKASPTGYELTTVPSALNCNLH
jgi:hypothetical protein